MSLEEYSKKRFLIVDELDTFCFSTKKTLKELGLKLVDSASSAQKVITGFENINYDLVLCNYELGKGKNGQELLEELRYRKLLKFTGLFFIISAEVEKGKVMGTIENEPDGYLVKPVTPKDLSSRLSKALAMKDAMRLIDTAIDDGDFNAAINYCDRKIAEKDRYVVRCLKTKAWLLGKIGELDQAKEVYESIIKSNNFIWAEYGLAKIAVKQEDYSRAETLLNSIITKDPYQLEAKDLLAEIFKKQNNISAAQSLLKDAIKLSPNSLLRQKELANLCVINNEQDDALLAYRKMHKLSDQSIYAKPEQTYDFANFLAVKAKDTDDKTNNPDIKEAFDLLESTKKRFSSYANINEQSKLVSANVNGIIGNEEEARAIVKEVLGSSTKDQFDAKTLKIAAGTLNTLGDTAQAEDLLEQAADLARGDTQLISEIYDQLNSTISLAQRKEAATKNKQGIKLYSEGDINQAAQVLREAVPLTPRHISLNLNLAQVLLKQYKQNNDPSTLEDAGNFLHKIRHIPNHHKEFKRFEHLMKLLNRKQAK